MSVAADSPVVPLHPTLDSTATTVDIVSVTTSESPSSPTPLNGESIDTDASMSPTTTDVVPPPHTASESNASTPPREEESHVKSPTPSSAKEAKDARAPPVSSAAPTRNTHARSRKHSPKHHKDKGHWNRKKDPVKEDFALTQQHWPSLKEVTHTTKGGASHHANHNGNNRDFSKASGGGGRKKSSDASHKVSKSGGKKKPAWIPLEVTPQTKPRGYERRSNRKNHHNSRGQSRRGRGGSYASRRDRHSSSSTSSSRTSHHPIDTATTPMDAGAYYVPSGAFYPPPHHPSYLSPIVPMVATGGAGALVTGGGGGADVVEPILQAIARQVEYYFSVENLIRDMYLRQQMDAEGWVPLALISNFAKMKSLGADAPTILQSLESSSVELEISGDHSSIRRRNGWESFVLPTESVAYIPSDREAPAQSTNQKQSQDVDGGSDADEGVSATTTTTTTTTTEDARDDATTKE